MRYLRLPGMLLGVLLLFASTALSHAQTSIVLRGARIVDGSGGDPIDNGSIVISDGRIAANGPAASTTPPAGAEIVDYSGKTIIPGLISAHSHVGFFFNDTATTE